MPLPIAVALLFGAATQSRIAVMDVRVHGGISESVGPVLSEAIVTEVRKRLPQAAVISADEIRSMIQVQGTKQQLGCHSDKDMACLAEIGGALGAERLVVGTLGKIGRTYVYTLKLFDAARARVLRNASSSLSSKDDDALLAATVQLVDQLFPDQPPPPPEVVVQPNVTAPPPSYVEPPPPAVVAAPPRQGHSELASVLLGVAGLACAGVAVYGLIQVLDYRNDVSAINGNRTGLSYDTVQSDKNAANVGQVLLFAGGGLALAGLTGAVVTW